MRLDEMLWRCLRPGTDTFVEEVRRQKGDAEETRVVSAALAPAPEETVLVFHTDNQEFRRGDKSLEVADALFFVRRAGAAKPTLLFLELKGSARSDNRTKGEDQLASLIRLVIEELPASCHHEGASERVALLAFGASRTVPNDQLRQAQFRKRTGVKLKYAYDLYEQSPYSLRPHIPSR